MSKTEIEQPPAPIFFNFVQINATPDVVNFNIGIRAESTENPALIIKTPGINSEELQARIRALCTLSNETLN